MSRRIFGNLRVGSDQVDNDNRVPIINPDRNFDAYARLRTSNPFTRFEVQHQYNEQPLIWNDTLTSGGSITHLPDESCVRLTTTTTSGSKVTRQSKEHFRYEPGKSQLIIMTGSMGSKKTGVRQRIGYFDDDNGLFFEQDENNLKVVSRSSVSGSVVDTTINQSDWNLDKLDGTGASGINIDTSFAQIFVIDFQWLGVGRVRYGIMSKGDFVYVHEELNSNKHDSAYMTTANLPIAYEIENTSSTSSSTDMKQICSSVSSEGGFLREGFPFTANNGSTAITVSTRRPILSIRRKATFNGITNTGLIIPVDFSVFTVSSNIFFEIVQGGTLSGSSFTSVNSDSLMESDVSSSTISGGIIIKSGYLPSGNPGKAVSAVDVGLLSKLILDGTEPLSIVATSLSGSTDTFGAFDWREIY
jgi:hypothetical protein